MDLVQPFGVTETAFPTLLGWVYYPWSLSPAVSFDPPSPPCFPFLLRCWLCDIARPLRVEPLIALLSHDFTLCDHVRRTVISPNSLVAFGPFDVDGMTWYEGYRLHNTLTLATPLIASDI